jgi:hypothetical protein
MGKTFTRGQPLIHQAYKRYHNDAAIAVNGFYYDPEAHKRYTLRMKALRLQKRQLETVPPTSDSTE